MMKVHANIMTGPVDYSIPRETKYEFFKRLRDEKEEDVIEFMKHNPWTITCQFLFDVLGSQSVVCSCSKDVEFRPHSTVSSAEILRRLEICIAFQRCPHILILEKALPVSLDQDISSDELLKHCDLTVFDHAQDGTPSNIAGLSWTHIALLLGKERILRKGLRLLRKYNSDVIPRVMLTHMHGISSILLAVYYCQLPTVKYLSKIYPHLIFSEPKLYESSGTKYPVNALTIALSAWKLDMVAVQSKYSQHTKEFSRSSSKYFYSAWSEKRYGICDWMIQRYRFNDFVCYKKALEEAMQKNDNTEIDILLKVKDLWDHEYFNIFQTINRTGHVWMYRKIFLQSNFIKRYIRPTLCSQEGCNKLARFGKLPGWCNYLMVHAVLTGDPSIVKLFIDGGFNVNARHDHGIDHDMSRKSYFLVDALTWAENLGYKQIYEMLLKAGAKKRLLSKPNSLVYAALRHGDMFNTLHIIHDLCENGHSSEVIGHWDSTWDHWKDKGNDSIVRACLTRQYHVVKYFLLRGAGPKPFVDKLCIDMNMDWKRIVYLILTTNSTQKWGDIVCRIYRESNYSMLLLQVVLRASFYTCIRGIIEDSMNSYERLTPREIPKDLISNPSYNRLKSLKEFCRSTLRSYFRNYLYLRFLQQIKRTVSREIYEYLKMDYLLDTILTESERRQFDKETSGAEKFFL